MRIGFHIEVFDPARGGFETYVTHISKCLLALGHEVHAISRIAPAAPEGVVVHLVPPWTPETVEAASRQAGLDLVIGNGQMPGATLIHPHGGTYVGTIAQNLALIRNPLLRSLATAFNPINPTYRRRAARERAIYTATPPPHVIAVSKMVRRDLQTHYNLPDDHIHVVYNGADIERFTEAKCDQLREQARAALNLPQQAVCFLTVAHNPILKGVRELIDAAAILAKKTRNFRIVFVGRGPKTRLQLHAKLKGVGDLVQFPGPFSDILRAYAAADVYVHPTWYDPCSLSIMEAWACALPTITTRFNGAGELITDTHDGHLIDTPADVQSLANRMSRLLLRPERSLMGKFARTLAERYSTDRNVEGILQVIENVMSAIR